MHEPDVLKAAEQIGELGKLHRLPQSEARGHDQHADDHDAEIEDFLHGVVAGEVVMAQAKSQRFAYRDENFARRNRKQFLPKTPGDDAVAEIGNAVENENPHAEEKSTCRRNATATRTAPICRSRWRRENAGRKTECRRCRSSSRYRS